MLTRKQHELLTFINESLETTGIAPSYDEMKDAVRLKSKSGIHRLITALEERGFIRRLPKRARAIEVVKLSREAERARAGGSNVVHADFAGARGGEIAAVAVPLYGKIAAGTPIEAISNVDREVEVPAALIGAGEHYALEVEGDSMVGAGILEGDIAVVDRSDTAENGQIVVALVDDAEATLKRLRRKGDSIALEAENPEYETRIFGPDRVKVQGRLVGLIRRY